MFTRYAVFPVTIIAATSSHAQSYRNCKPTTDLVDQYRCIMYVARINGNYTNCPSVINQLLEAGASG